MDQSRHTVTERLSDERAHAAINSKLLKRLDHVEKLYEIELAETQTEHNEPIIVRFSLLQYAKLRMLELYYNFFSKLYDVIKVEVWDVDSNSLYLALAEKKLEDCIKPEFIAEWQKLQSNDCVNNVTADARANFFKRTCCVKHKQHDKRELFQTRVQVYGDVFSV